MDWVRPGNFFFLTWNQLFHAGNRKLWAQLVTFPDKTDSFNTGCFLEFALVDEGFPVVIDLSFDPFSGRGALVCDQDRVIVFDYLSPSNTACT
jgi:hypothetical protein